MLASPGEALITLYFVALDARAANGGTGRLPLRQSARVCPARIEAVARSKAAPGVWRETAWITNARSVRSMPGRAPCGSLTAVVVVGSWSVGFSTWLYVVPQPADSSPMPARASASRRIPFDPVSTPTRPGSASEPVTSGRGRVRRQRTPRMGDTDMTVSGVVIHDGREMAGPRPVE